MTNDKCYYARFLRVLPIMILLLIASAVVVVAQETANNIGIVDPIQQITVPKIILWNYKPILIAWIAAVAIGVGVVEFWKHNMNTVFLKKEADVYIVPNSLVFSVKTDKFLYSNVTKIRRQTQNRSR